MKKAPWMVFVAALFALAACSPQSAEQPQVSQAVDAAPAESASITQDRAGNPITLPKEVNKIISMAPSITETLIALGLGDRLVAIDAYSVGFAGLPEDIAVFDMMTPDTEQLIAMQPDIVFATGMSLSQGTDPFKPITDAGVCLIYVPSSNSIEGLTKDLLFIGEVTQTRAQAENLVRDMEAEIDRIAAIGQAITEPKKVYFEIAAAPHIYSTGQNTFLHEMIAIIGAKNVFDYADEWISVSEEAVVEANPDVIFTNVDYIDDPVGEIKARTAWSAVTALQNDQVFYIEKNPSSLPNHNIVVALREMAEKVYPEQYAK